MKNFKEYYNKRPEYIVYYDKKSTEIRIYKKYENFFYVKKYVIRTNGDVRSFKPSIRVDFMSRFQLDFKYPKKYWKMVEMDKKTLMKKLGGILTIGLI